MAKKDINYSKKINFKDNESDYIFQLKKRHWKWLWLLLLLLLFIRCEREIDVTAIEDGSKNPIPDVEVELSYTAHCLFKNGKFFCNEPISRTMVTDDDGRAEFKKLPCSLYSYIFYALSKATYRSTADCHYQDPNPDHSLFHYTWNKTLIMVPKTVDLDLTVLDRETEEQLAGAVVEYQFSLAGEEKADSTITEANGKCTLMGVPLCGEVLLSCVSCYGYADTTNVLIDVPTALACSDSAVVHLTPLKESFTYFVKNKYTKQPVPGATVEVVLRSGRGKILRGQSTTNVDGRGVGAYEDAFVLAELELNASKSHYKDGHLDKKYTVEKFASLPDSQCVVYLEPEPYMEQFQNVDSITGEPIAGVTNKILNKTIKGTEENSTEISNRNGIFYIKAMEGDHITINSELKDYYEPKTTIIDKFDKGQIIKMKPIRVDLTFRTIEGDTGDILPDCDLKVSATVTHASSPTNSGSGTFAVKNLFAGERISITASKDEYGTNSSKVNNAKVIDLMKAPQSRRDIPLMIELPPCNASQEGKNNVSAGSVFGPVSYNVGQTSGTFELLYETGSTCSDCIDVYNHTSKEDYNVRPPIFSTGQIITNGPMSRAITFSNGTVITIVVTTGPKDDSMWNYHISCPE